MAAILNEVRLLNRKLYALETRRDQAQSRMINRISRGHSNLVMTSELSDATQVLQEEDRSIHIEIIDAETRKDKLMLRLHGEKTKDAVAMHPNTVEMVEDDNGTSDSDESLDARDQPVVEAFRTDPAHIVETLVSEFSNMMDGGSSDSSGDDVNGSSQLDQMDSGDSDSDSKAGSAEGAHLGAHLSD
jgi:hypothetical protein